MTDFLFFLFLKKKTTAMGVLRTCTATVLVLAMVAPVSGQFKCVGLLGSSYHRPSRYIDSYPITGCNVTKRTILII